MCRFPGEPGVCAAHCSVYARDEVLSGEPDAGNSHVRFDEGRGSRTPLVSLSLLLDREARQETGRNDNRFASGEACDWGLPQWAVWHGILVIPRAPVCYLPYL